MIVSDFWLGVILTIAAEAIITILVVDYLGQKEREENNKQGLLKVNGWIGKFEENRFFPVQMANVGCE